MKICGTELSGVFVITNPVFSDNRGCFCKVFHDERFRELGLSTDFRESYYSISARDVIRGMHFQLPPDDHDKLICVPRGRILDVVLDLRISSKTFGQAVSVELSDQNRGSVYIPKGCAHGFKSLENDTITLYSVTTVYNRYSDSGVRWDSFGFDWQIGAPILSDRDQAFATFAEFQRNGENWP